MPRPARAPAAAPTGAPPLQVPKKAAPGSSCVGVKRIVTGGFQARVPCHLGPPRLLGNYGSEVDAARAVDRALRSLGVPESALNFPRLPADDAEAAGTKPASRERGPVTERRPAPLQPVARREAAPPPADDEAAFVLALQPPLSSSAEVLAALRSNGVTARHLRALGAVLAHPGVSTAAKERTVTAAFADCGVRSLRDKAALLAGLQRAGRRR
jgi:hypothetical protein